MFDNNTTNPSLGQSLSQNFLDDLAQIAGDAPVPGVSPDRGISGMKKGQTPISCPFQIASTGLDTLHISYDIDNQNEGLMYRLFESKKVLQSTSESECVFKFLENGSDCFEWNLQRSGNKLYPYVLRTGDLILCMSNRQAGSNIPNMSLLVGSLSCHQDVKKLLNTFKFWLSCIDVFLLSEKVSRVDLCADMVHDIKKGRIDKIRNYITRARDTHVFYSHRKFTGVQWGSGDIVCRIYDKQLQMQQCQQLEKSIFFNSIWSTTPDIPITRIEFQVRRSALVQFFEKNSTTVDDILSRGGDLWRYLTADWLRHCKNYVDVENNHQSRSENSHFWDIVQTAWKTTPEHIERKRNQIHINIPALRAQAAGILTTIAAGLGHIPEYFDIMATISKIVAEDICNLMAQSTFPHAFRAKQNRAVCSF